MKLLLTVSTILLFSIGTYSVIAQPESESEKENDSTVITLMVVYTQAAEDWADENEGGIDNVIAQGIALTNQYMQNSDINVEVKLVHSVKVNYKETGDSNDDLKRLRDPEDGFLDEVHRLRDEYKADFVKIIPRKSDFCGRAYRAWRPEPRDGFSLTAVGCATYSTFAHELGHNFGFAHSRNQKSYPAPDDGGIFEYSTGWQWMGNDGKGYISIMSYTQPPEFISEAPYYSNPNIKFKGGKTGSYTGKGSPADNSRSLRETKDFFSGYRGPANETDSLAMVALYEKTNGENWDDNTNWADVAPLREWHGINRVAWRIFSLWISDNNLSGPLPSELGNLKELRELALPNNHISGSIPEEIWNLSSMEWLSLANNELSGSISKEIGRLINLVDLSLWNNSLTGKIPAEINKLKKLRSLSLGYNQLTGEIPKWLGSLSNLRYLHLGHNDLNGIIPSEIGELGNLKGLDLGYNELVGKIPLKIGNLKNLSDLYLDNNELTGKIPSEIGNLSNLRNLSIQNNDFRGSIPLSFTKLEELYEFYFNDTFLCTPPDQNFNNWLSNVENVEGTGVKCEDVQPGEIALEVPANNSSDQSLSPLLQWSQSENAENYHIQISKDEGFNELVLDSSDVNIAELQLNNLESGTTFYWRVRATNDYLDSEWTNTWSFTTSDAPPPDNVALSTQGNNIELNWTPVDSDAVTSYLILKGETTASLELYESVDPSQSTFSEEPSQGSSFYAVSAEYGEGVQSNITTILSYYNNVQTISDSWQLIGAPVQGQELNPQNVDIFGFDRIYKRDETMLPGKGYWIRSDNTEELDLAGEGLIETEVELNSGWNLVGGIADVIPAASIKDPSGILTEAPVYEYSGSSYSQVSNLKPGKGYWIYASEDGMIKLEHGEPQVSAKRKEKPLLADINALNFRSGTASQTFWVSEQPIDKKEKLSFLMPPKAPEPIIDVRTTDGYAIGDENRLVIDITAALFPVEVTAQMNQDESGDYAYRLVGIEDGREAHYNLSASKAVRIEKNYDQFYLERVQKDELINEYSLFSNYPNPFNPSTNISYQLPKESHVMVEVFDIAGRRVASLVDAPQRAGVYTVRFDGSNQASGIYFLRFQAGQFTEIQKLTLIK